MSVGDIFKLYLENIVSGGDALGRYNGKTIFVEGGAPNETVLCQITEDRKTWAKAQLLEIVEPSPLRIDIPCEFYGKCGGCNLMHINYETQLEIKTNILKDSFLRFAGIEPPEIEIYSSPHFEYRNRMQFHCFRESAKNADSPKFGLSGRKSGEKLAISDCPIAVPPIRQLLKRAGEGLTLPVEKDRFNVFAKDDVLLNEGGQERGRIKLLEKEITVDAKLFFQSNCVMLEKLIMVLQKIAETADRDLPMADLYCGVGTFSVFLGDMFPKIILAEENKNAVSLARENLKGKMLEFYAFTDTNWTFLNSQDDKPFIGFAVVDPPRAGLSQTTAKALSQFGPPVIAYVSCDPSSLARDAKILIHGGYNLTNLKFFDFYPQTAHVESVGVFCR